MFPVIMSLLWSTVAAAGTGQVRGLSVVPARVRFLEHSFLGPHPPAFDGK